MKKVLFTVIALSIIVLLSSCAVPTDTAAHTTALSTLKTDEIIQEAIMYYYTVEDACREATDIVVATYLGKRAIDHQHTEYRFSVSERILGSAEDEISVCAMHIPVFIMGSQESYRSYYDDDVPMEIGREYLLPLVCRPSVYTKNKYYGFICGLAIDVQAPLSSIMYGKREIEIHVKELNLKGMEKSALSDAIREITKNNVVQAAPPSAKNIQELASMATDILVIKVGKCQKVISTPYEDTVFHNCIVEDVLKTSTLDVESQASEVEIKFLQNTVEEGDTVIVFAERIGSFYILASTDKNVSCVQPVDKKDEIVSLIKATK